MLEGGKCPDCGDLADHYPCKAEENVELQDEDVEGDDIIAKQDAEEIATNRRTGKVDVCPGCGATLYEFIWREGQTFGETTYMVDAHGLYHFGPGGCADPCGERRTEYYPIEFELKGKDGKRSGVTLGENPQDAIRNFLADYPTSGDCGTIVAIRVPGVDTGGLA